MTDGITVCGKPLDEYLAEIEGKEKSEEAQEDIKCTQCSIFRYRKPRLNHNHKERNGMARIMSQEKVNREYLHKNIEAAKSAQEQMIAMLLSMEKPMTSEEIAQQLSVLTGRSWSKRMVPTIIGFIKKSDLGYFLLKHNFLRDTSKGGIKKGYNFIEAARSLSLQQAISLYRKGDKSVQWKNCEEVFPFLADAKKAVLEQRALHGPRTKEQVEEWREEREKPKIKAIKARRGQLKFMSDRLKGYGAEMMGDEEGAKLLCEIFSTTRHLFRSETGPGYGVRFPHVAEEYLLQLGEEVEKIANLHPGNTQVIRRISEIRETIDMIYGSGGDPASTLQFAGQKIISILQDHYYHNQAVQVEAETLAAEICEYTDVPKKESNSGLIEAIQRHLPKMSSELRKEIFHAISSAGDIGDNKTFTINPTFTFNFSGKIPEIHLDGHDKNRLLESLRILLHGVDTE